MSSHDNNNNNNNIPQQTDRNLQTQNRSSYPTNQRYQPRDVHDSPTRNLFQGDLWPVLKCKCVFFSLKFRFILLKTTN